MSKVTVTIPASDLQEFFDDNHNITIYGFSWTDGSNPTMELEVTEDFEVELEDQGFVDQDEYDDLESKFEDLEGDFKKLERKYEEQEDEIFALKDAQEDLQMELIAAKNALEQLSVDYHQQVKELERIKSLPWYKKLF